MSQKIIKARMFEKSEYGFNSFCLKDFNYGSVYLEQLVEYNGIECFEYNTMCSVIYNIFNKHNIYKLLRIEKITLSYFKYSDGTLKFFSNDMKDITNEISSSIISEITTPTHNKIYRHRYTISEDLVVARLGTLGINPNTQMDVVKDEMYTKESFFNNYGVLPEKSFSFSELHV